MPLSVLTSAPAWCRREAADTEQGIGIVVHEDDADNAVEVLQEEFESGLQARGHTSAIYAEKNLAVIALVGMSLAHFDRPSSHSSEME